MKIKELIKKLKDLQLEHGNLEVYSGGNPYPGKVIKIDLVRRGDAHVPSGVAKIKVRHH